MSRCKVFYKINSDIFETLGILNGNRLTFMENDIKFILEFNNEELKIKRENNEYKINLIIGKNSSCTYELKDIKYKKLVMNVDIKSLEINNNEIKAKYKLEDVIFNLYLKYEVIE